MPHEFRKMEIVDIPSIVAGVGTEWANVALTQVDGCVVRLGVIDGDFPWHKHSAEDEFFLTLEGELSVDMQREGGVVETVSLGVHQGYTVPQGVVHRTRAGKRCVVLLVEKAGVVPEGD